MKNGSVYAVKLKKAYAKFRPTVTVAEIPAPDDVLHQLAVGIFAEGSGVNDGRRAVRRALAKMVDWNEMRVSTAVELNKAAGNMVSQGTNRCQMLIDALGAIYALENQLSIAHLRSLGRREARRYLEDLKGVGAYATASVILWCLDGHAIPVDDRLWESLKQEGLVAPDASREEVQAFLERNISAADAKTFCLVMQSFASSKRAAPKRANASKPETKIARDRKHASSTTRKRATSRSK